MSDQSQGISSVGNDPPGMKLSKSLSELLRMTLENSNKEEIKLNPLFTESQRISITKELSSALGDQGQEPKKVSYCISDLN